MKLRKPAEREPVVEFSYRTDLVTAPRFPTVADAGWNPSFKPAPEREPDGSVPATCWGWTEPLGPWPPQPEIVHDNAGLRILDRPPRLIGMVPP